MSYTQKAVYGAGFILIVGLLASAVAYGTRVFLARKLGPAEYGLYSSVLAGVIIFLFIRDLGFPQAVIKHVAEFAAKQQFSHIKSVMLSAFTFQMLGSIILAVPLFFLSDWLSLSYFKDPRAAKMLQLFVWYIFGSALFIISKDTLMGFKKTVLFSLGELLKNGIVFWLIVLFFSLGYGIMAPVWAYVLVCPLLLIFYLPWLWRTFPFLRYKSAEFSMVAKKLLAFAVPVFATSAGGKAIGYIDTLILTYYRTPAEVGIYNAMLPTALLFMYIGTAVASISFPLSAELFAQKKYTALKEGVRLVHSYLLIVATPLIGFIFVFAPFFIRVLFGNEYVLGAMAFQILVVGVLFYIIAVINHNILSAIGKPWLVTKIVLCSAVINIVLNFFLIPKTGIFGAALATSVSYTVALVWSTFLITKELSLSLPLARWGKVLGAGIIFAGIVYLSAQSISLSPWLEIFFSLLIAFPIYAVLVYWWKLIDISEIKYYWKVLQKK